MMTNKKETHHETLLRAKLRQEIDTGIVTSRDPANADLPKDAVRTTTMYSAWYVRSCPECKQRFRDGDGVRLCLSCEQAYHDDELYQLYCWHEHFKSGRVCREARFDPITEVHDQGCPYQWAGGEQSVQKPTGSGAARAPHMAQVTTQFLQGLEEVWTPYGQEPVLVVDDDSPIIGYSCPWCRFQVRAGDRVVKCPCGKCNAHFHDDIYRHMTCWNDWKIDSKGNDYCPITGEKIEAAMYKSERNAEREY
jgi:hypothetical protein